MRIRPGQTPSKDFWKRHEARLERHKKQEEEKRQKMRDSFNESMGESPKQARMTNEELKSKGLIRIPGFTRADGTKVKSHIRKIT